MYVSLLTSVSPLVFSKIMEKLMCNRLSFCEKHSILYDYQTPSDLTTAQKWHLSLLLTKKMQSLTEEDDVLGVFFGF